MKKCNLMVLSLAFFLAAAALATSSSPVFAQTPCIAQASYPAVSTPQYNSNLAVTVPVSASCSYLVGPLFAVGDAYDTTISTDLGTVSTGLSLIGGGSYSGQLLFSLPTSTIGHTVQFSVSIYNNNNGQYGTPLATTSQSITIGSSIYQSYPYNYCPPGYAYAGGTCYPPSYYSNCYNGYYYAGSSCYYPGYYSNNYYYSGNYGGSNGNGNWNGNGNGNWNGNGNGNWNGNGNGNWNGNGNNNWNHGNWNNGNGNGNWNNGNGNWNHGNGNNNWNNGNGNSNWNHGNWNGNGNGNGNWNNGNDSGHHHHS